MKWIKASERLPSERGLYFTKDIKTQHRFTSYYTANTKSRLFCYPQDYEWLDESADDIDEEVLWDEFSQYVDDDIDSLSSIAGISIMKKSDFKKMIEKIKS